MTIKIATIGSCVTRDNFNSSFNPYYKDYFEVIAHQNQVAIPSLMSEPTELNIDKDFLKYDLVRQRHIKSEFDKTFLQNIKKAQPEYILIDLNGDVKFGLIEINKDSYITDNWRFKKIPELYKKKKLNFINDYDTYFEIWKSYIDKLFNYLDENLPNTKVIMVNARFNDKFPDNTSVDRYREKSKLPIQNIVKMNSLWNQLDSYIAKNYNVLNIDMTQEKYYLDKNHLWGKYYLHFEPKFYKDFLVNLLNIVYKDEVLTNSNNIIDEKSKLFKNQKIDFDDVEQKLINAKRVEVITNSDTNLIKLARKNKDAYNLYKKLLEQDYVLYFHKEGVSKLYKRKYVNELFKRKDLIKSNEVYYTLDKPKDRKINEDIPRKLLVIFTCMPPQNEYDSHLMPKRMFTKFFDGIERSLVKNVYTMRIMDLNVSHGSHYISTVNYQNYENEIQQAILQLKQDLNIQDENIVFYGVSKGGTGALYHGSALDFKTLAVDPILNIGDKLEDNDRRFLKNLRKEDLVPDINKNLNKYNTMDKYLICSEKVPLYYEQDMRLEKDKLKILNKIDNLITSHPEVSRNTIPEQLMILNTLLGGFEYN